MGQHPRLIGDQRRTESADLAVDLLVFLGDGEGFIFEADFQFEDAPIKVGLSKALHPLQRPGQVHRSWPTGGKMGTAPLKFDKKLPARFLVDIARSKPGTNGGGNTDGRRTTHDHTADRLGDVLIAVVVKPYFLLRQQPLIKHLALAGNKTDGTNHTGVDRTTGHKGSFLLHRQTFFQ